MVMGIDFARIPHQIGNWKAIDVPVTEKEKQQVGQNEQIVRIYTKGEKEVHLVAIQEGNNRHRIHSPVDCYTAGGWTIVNKTNLDLGKDPDKTVRRMRADKGSTSRIVYYWFTNVDERTASFEVHLLLYLKNVLIHPNANSWTYFQVSADIKEDGNATDEILEGFIDELDQQNMIVQAGILKKHKTIFGL